MFCLPILGIFPLIWWCQLADAACDKNHPYINPAFAFDSPSFSLWILGRTVYLETEKMKIVEFFTLCFIHMLAGLLLTLLVVHRGKSNFTINVGLSSGFHVTCSVILGSSVQGHLFCSAFQEFSILEENLFLLSLLRFVNLQHLVFGVSFLIDFLLDFHRYHDSIL